MINTAVIFQVSAIRKLLNTILFSTGKGLLRVVDQLQVPLQIEFLSKLLCATWLRASMRSFFDVHSLNVPC